MFVHGFNNGFDDGIYRLTQIAADTSYPGTPVLFSWASGGRITDYVYDKESANAARDDLEATLRLLAATKVKSIDIIAHSMGTWVTMEALRQLAITGDRDLRGKLGYVILASPDIDVDVFKKQMLRYGKPDKPFTVLLSGDDRALQISGLISGSRPRVGDYNDAADLASYGVIVVDLTRTKSGDRLNHAKFADNPILVQLLGDRLSAPASLSSTEPPLNEQRINDLGHGIGQAVGAVAEIVITTPFKVLTGSPANEAATLLMCRPRRLRLEDKVKHLIRLYFIKDKATTDAGDAGFLPAWHRAQRGLCLRRRFAFPTEGSTTALPRIGAAGVSREYRSEYGRPRQPHPGRSASPTGSDGYGSEVAGAGRTHSPGVRAFATAGYRRSRASSPKRG